MNREIKFRGKRIDNGEWVYGYFVKDPLGKCRIYWKPFDEATSNTYHFVAEESVGQLIGITDSKGKYIYEWDIIRLRHDLKINRVVQYNEDEGFVATDVTDPKASIGIGEWMKDAYPDLTVIGNIFDAPELLK